MFLYQGHQVKFKVAGVTQRVCVCMLFMGGLSSIERPSCTVNTFIVEFNSLASRCKGVTYTLVLVVLLRVEAESHGPHYTTNNEASAKVTSHHQIWPPIVYVTICHFTAEIQS